MIFLVYKTDAWHSYASRDLIGVGTNLNNAIKLCKKQAKKDNVKIDSDQLFNLNNLKQTQGLNDCEFEFVIESIEKNVLI